MKTVVCCFVAVIAACSAGGESVPDAGNLGISVPDPGNGPANWFGGSGHETANLAFPVGVVTSINPYIDGDIGADESFYFVFRAGPDLTEFSAQMEVIPSVART